MNVDRFSMYFTFILTSMSCLAEMTSQLFLKNAVKLWGVPVSIINDQDGRFLGTFKT